MNKPITTRIRMTVEYDSDCCIDPGDTTKVEEFLEREKQYWIDRDVDVSDILATEGTVKFELVEDKGGEIR